MLQARQSTDHTCHICARPHKGGLQALARNNYDPTRTTTLRNEFARQMGKRFRELRGVIRKAIIDQDCFGLMNPQTNMEAPGRKEFDFARSSKKVDAFMEWLEEQQQRGILEIKPGQQVGQAVEDAWTNTYIESSYQKGIARGRQELRNAGYKDKNGDPIPALENDEQLKAAFNQPFHADRVGTLYTRVFRDLKGITDTMDTQISRVLSQAMAEGKHPREMAKLLTRTISGPVGDLGITDTLGRFIPAERRARVLARTETIRAHHQATVQEYKNWGAEGVKVKAEWTTAGDARVCAECAMLQGRVYDLKEIEGMIPRHPQCRCIALPVDRSEVGPPKADKELEEVKKDPVASRLKTEDAQRQYVRKKREYRQYFDENFDDYDLGLLERDAKGKGLGPYTEPGQRLDDLVENKLRPKAKDEFPDMYQGMKQWQASTWKEKAVDMKVTATSVDDVGDMLWKSSFPDEAIEGILSRFDGKKDDLISQYVNMRAFNQAYMEKRKIKKVTLHRGTDGRTGKKIVNNMTREGMQRTKHPITDAPIAGYSSSKTIANRFGTKVGGITVTKKVDRSDIVVHENLMCRLTGEFKEEHEFIIRGGRFEIDSDNVTLPKGKKR